jgi:HSP20 family protein
MKLIPIILNSDMNENFLSSYAPPTDIYETENEVVVECSLPGFTAEQIDIELEDNILTIAGQRNDEEYEEDPGKNYYRREIKQQSFQRSFMLPVPVVDTDSEEDVEATFKDGELIVKMKKAEASRKKKISINA